jgi:hypothetical protein
LKNNNNQVRRHRGSSPPFQDESQGFFDFMKDSQSTCLNSDVTEETHAHKQKRYETGNPINMEYDHHQDKNVEINKQSLDKVEFQKNKNDDARWQDDGGKSGLAS